MPAEPEMLPKSRIHAAIRAAYEAGKSAERFFDRNVGRMPEEPGRGNGAGGKRPEQDWHH